MAPALRTEDVTARLMSPRSGVISYAIYADDVEIAGVNGKPGSAELVFRGSPDPDIFLPDNLVELIGIANPAETKRWSDKKIMKHASAVASVGMKGGNVAVFNLNEWKSHARRASKHKHLDEAYAYRLALHTNTALVFSVDIALDGVFTTFRYYPYPVPDLRDRQGRPVVVPAVAFSSQLGIEHPHRHLRRLGQPGKLQITAMPRQCEGVQMRRGDRRYRLASVERNLPCVHYWQGDARTGRMRHGIYTIERSNGSDWSPEIMAFVKQNHSNHVVRSIDNAALISCVARVSQVIAAQLSTMQGHQLR